MTTTSVFGGWSFDEDDVVVGGTTTIIGPDGKAWTMSANPDFHDREIAERALVRIYIEGVADLVDPEALSEQVKLITRQRDRVILDLPDAAARLELLKGPEGD